MVKFAQENTMQAKEKMGKEEFLGFDFTVKGEDIIVDDPKRVDIHDDDSASTGDISEIDTYFNDTMIKAQNEINEILKQIK